MVTRNNTSVIQVRDFMRNNSRLFVRRLKRCEFIRPGQASPQAREVNRGGDLRPGLLAIPAFDRIAGLKERQLCYYNWGFCPYRRFLVFVEDLDFSILRTGAQEAHDT